MESFPGWVSHRQLSCGSSLTYPAPLHVCSWHRGKNTAMNIFCPNVLCSNICNGLQVKLLVTSYLLCFVRFCVRLCENKRAKAFLLFAWNRRQSGRKIVSHRNLAFPGFIYVADERCDHKSWGIVLGGRGCWLVATRSWWVGVSTGMPRFPAFPRAFAKLSLPGFYAVKAGSFLTEGAAEGFEVFLGKLANWFSGWLSWQV